MKIIREYYYITKKKKSSLSFFVKDHLIHLVQIKKNRLVWQLFMFCEI